MASASAPGSRLTSLVNPYHYDVQCTYRYRLVANREERTGGATEFQLVISYAFAPPDPAVAVAYLDDDRFKLGERAVGQHIRTNEGQLHGSQHNLLQTHR